MQEQTKNLFKHLRRALAVLVLVALVSSVFFTTRIVESSFPVFAEGLEEYLHERLGSRIHFGEIRLILFPRPRIRLESLIIQSPEGYDRGLLANISNIDIQIPLAYLAGFRNRYISTDIVINKIIMNLYRSPGGGPFNISKFIDNIKKRIKADQQKKKKSAGKKGQKKPEPEKLPSDNPIENLLDNISNIRIRQVDFNVSDRHKSLVNVSPISVNLKSKDSYKHWSFFLESPGSLELSNVFKISTDYTITGELSFIERGLDINALLEAPHFQAYSNFKIKAPRWRSIYLEGPFSLKSDNLKELKNDFLGRFENLVSSLDGELYTEGNWKYIHHPKGGFSIDGDYRYSGMFDNERIGVVRLPVLHEGRFEFERKKSVIALKNMKGRIGALKTSGEVKFSLDKKWNTAVDFSLFGRLNTLRPFLKHKFTFGEGDTFITGKLKFPAIKGIDQSTGRFYIKAYEGYWPQTKAVSNFKNMVAANRKGAKKKDQTEQGWPYEEIKGAFWLKRGRIYTNDIKISTSSYIVSCRGVYNIYSSNFSILAQIRYLDSVEKVLENTPVIGFILSDGKDDFFSFPVKITGNSRRISFNPFTREPIKYYGGVVKRIVTSPFEIKKVFLPFMESEDDG